MKRVNILAAGAILLGQTLTGAALAATVTLAGSTVDFSFDDTLLGLFGQPTVAGDSIYFTPINFTAESMNGDGFDLTKQTINIKVVAHEDWDFSSLALTERGDYLRVGGAKLAVSGQIRAFDSMNPLNEVTASILNDEKKFKRTHDFVSRNWSAGATADLTDMSTAGMINVTLENILVANSLNNTGLAFIEKKFASLEVITTPVPEPETYAMLLAGLGLVGYRVARRHVA